MKDLEVHLSRSSWHYKLQGWVFGSNQPNFYSLCPYFWLTIFCIIISPIVLLVKGFIYGIFPFFKWIGDQWDKHIEKLVEKDRIEMEKLIQSMTPEELSKFILDKKLKNRMNKLFYISTGRYDYYSLIRLWKNLTGNEDSFSEIEEKMIKVVRKTEDKEIEKKEAIKKKLNINGIIKWTKRLVAVAVTALISYGLFTIVMYFINHTFHINWKVIGGFIGGVLLVLVCFIIALITLSKIADNIANAIKYGDTIAWYAYPFYWLAVAISWPFIMLWKIVVFIFKYFMSTKDDYCPGIIWDDEK